MSNYGNVAVHAAQYLVRNPNINPGVAWSTALAHYGVRDKSCPRTAFLGLCENGNIGGVPIGHYLNRRNTVNKIRAISVRNLIYNNTPPSKPTGTKKVVWQNITGISNGDIYGVINVVYDLFDNGLLI